MKKPNCHYVFLARTALRKAVSGNIEFNVVEKRFENENLILAREAAFIYRNNFLLGMLTEGIGISEDEIGWNSSEKKIEKLSDREIRRLINPFLEPEGETDEYSEEKEEGKWNAPDDTIAWYSRFKNGIWIVMKHNDTKLHEECGGDDDIVIDKISRYEEPLPTPPNCANLQEEYEFYKKHNCDTKSYKTSFVFFDDENYLEGFYRCEDESEEQANERHLDESIKVIECLRTPFDWTGYDKINWWDKKLNINPITKFEADRSQKRLPVTMEEALIEKEYHFCEFKPGLINRPNSNRDMEHENAQSICAFLNAKGGYLFIGVADNGEISGLDFSKITKDYFRRELTRIKSRYLPPFIAHTIYGDFYTIGKKEIFVVTIYPSAHEPIFLRRKDENNKLLSKEFYVRSDAASRHIYDIEEIVKYCKSHWANR
jgi:hypothetical protein